MDDYANYNKELYQMNTNMYQMNNGVVPNSPRDDSDQQRIDTDEPLYENLFNVENGDKEFDNFKANITERTGMKEEGGTMNFNMLEGFKSYDNMDLDESPPFNVNFDAFYDPLMDQQAITNDSNVLFNSDNNQDNGNLQNGIGVLPPKDEFVNTTSVPRVPSQQSFMPHTNSFVSMNNFRNNVPVDGFSQGLVDMKDYNSHKNLNLNNNASNMSGKSISNASLSINNTNSYYNELSPLTTTTSLTPSVSSVHSTQPSFFSAHQYLTRNSLDHPPSQQNRPSIDFYSKARTSFDSQQSSINQRQRTQVGGRYTSFTNSISNYIPFMGDRNQRTSNNSTPSESLSPPQPSAFINVPPQQAQQPRHLIRSIFKSSAVPSNANNNTNEDDIENSNGQDILNGDLNNQNTPSINNNGNDKNIDNIVDDSEFLDMDHLQQEPEDDIIESNIATKKARRSKRSLFTRFKTPVKMEPIDGSTDLFKTEEAISNNKNNLNKELDNENMETDMVGSASLHGLSINGTPSLDSTNIINGAPLDPATLNNSNNNNVNTAPANSMLEPDYGALFEKVGKRKNIVNPATYIRNKPRYKNEQSEVNSLNGSNNTSNSNTEKSSILNYNSGGSYPENIDPRNLNSINSDDSSINNRNIQVEGGDSDSDLSASLGSSSNTPSSLATASKRILGSKLMLKRKNSQTNMNTAPPPPPPPITTTIISKGVEVEVDLQSLDLPPTTQIFPTNIINSKNRTRGRKENKEADLVDLTKIYLCNYCSRRFKRQEHLKRHFRSLHTFEKPYDCSICHKKFSRSDNLNQHLKIHKQEEELAQQGLNTLDSIKTETHDVL